MKRILSAVLAVLMVFAVAGCGGDEVKGSVKNEEENTIFRSGKTDGKVYTNDFLKMGCELPSGWTFYTGEQIAELNKGVAENADGQFADDLNKVNIIYDMSAYSNDGAAVIGVTFEVMTEKKIKELDLKEYCQNTVDAFLETCEKQNLKAEGKVITAKIDGKKLNGINVSAKMSVQSVYTKSVFIKKGKYVACISANAKSQDTVDNLLKEFYFI